MPLLILYVSFKLKLQSKGISLRHNARREGLSEEWLEYHGWFASLYISRRYRLLFYRFIQHSNLWHSQSLQTFEDFETSEVALCLYKSIQYITYDVYITRLK